MNFLSWTYLQKLFAIRNKTRDPRNFWEGQVSPGHVHKGPHWNKLYAEEINILLLGIGYNGGPVLELGCGNGELFEHLLFDKQNYIGVDFSETMLAQFRIQFPTIELHCMDVLAFEADSEFGLVFCNGLIQDIKPSQLERLAANISTLLAPNGLFLCCNVPWRSLQREFDRGELDPIVWRKKRWRFLKRRMRNVLLGSHIGCWYTPGELLSYCPLNCELMVFGSLFQPYRFHFAFRRKGAGPSGAAAPSPAVAGSAQIGRRNADT